MTEMVRECKREIVARVNFSKENFENWIIEDDIGENCSL